MVVGFTTTCAISAYHRLDMEPKKIENKGALIFLSVPLGI
jgi:hypothetical protein